MRTRREIENDVQWYMQEDDGDPIVSGLYDIIKELLDDRDESGKEEE